MRSNRLEAFSDGVLAIIITIMVLELKVPDGPTLKDLQPTLSGLGTYLLRFVCVGIYWKHQIVRPCTGCGQTGQAISHLSSMELRLP